MYEFGGHKFILKKFYRKPTREELLISPYEYYKCKYCDYQISELDIKCILSGRYNKYITACISEEEKLIKVLEK